jgi:hypothetical protein
MNYQVPSHHTEIFEEAMQAYLINTLDISQVGSSIEQFFHDKLLVSRVIQKGLSFTFFEKIQTLLSFTESD